MYPPFAKEKVKPRLKSVALSLLCGKMIDIASKIEKHISCTMKTVIFDENRSKIGVFGVKWRFFIKI